MDAGRLESRPAGLLRGRCGDAAPERALGRERSRVEVRAIDETVAREASVRRKRLTSIGFSRGPGVEGHAPASWREHVAS